jgi:malate dehydrogenase
MFAARKAAVAAARRALSTGAAHNARVTVIGGAGGIGQPLSLLLKLSPVVSHVSVLDIVGAPGVAADLSHIDTKATASGHGMTLKEFQEANDEQKAAAKKAATDAALKVRRRCASCRKRAAG